MKKMNVTYQLFTFDELPEEGQHKAIDDYIEFLMETTDLDNPDIEPELLRAFKQAERMQTPWFTGSYIWDYCKESILQYLRDPDFFYLEDGNLAIEEGQLIINTSGLVNFTSEVQS